MKAPNKIVLSREVNIISDLALGSAQCWSVRGFEVLDDIMEALQIVLPGKDGSIHIVRFEHALPARRMSRQWKGHIGLGELIMNF